MNGFTHSLETVLNLPLPWHLCGVALVAFLFLLDYKSKRGGIVVIFLWNLIGVFLHELAHFLAGSLLFAKPTGFSIIPRQQEHGYRLGAVSFKGLNALNSLPVGLAPLGLIVVAFLCFQYWMIWFPPTLISTVGMYFASFVLMYNSLPSMQDLKIAFGLKSILLYGVASVIIYKCISGY